MKRSIGELKMIPIDRLVVEHGYQRQLSANALARMGKWDWSLCSTLSCCADNGKFHVVDGQHRLALAKEYGVKALPCYVFSSDSVADEARAFAAIQMQRRAVLPVEYLRALVAAGDSDAMNIEAIALANGYRLAGGNANDVISAARALIKSYEVYGPDSLDRALYILRRAWRGASGSSAAGFIVGLARFVSITDPDVKDANDLADRLAALRPADVKALRPRGATYEQYAEVFAGIYNRKRTSRRIDLSLFTHVEAVRRGSLRRWARVRGEE